MKGEFRGVGEWKRMYMLQIVQTATTLVMGAVEGCSEVVVVVKVIVPVNVAVACTSSEVELEVPVELHPA